FCDKLLRDSRQTCAQTQTDSDFAFTFHHSRQQKRSHVNTRNDENERRCAKRRVQRHPHISHQILFQWNQVHLDIARFFRNASQDGGEILFRHRWRDSRLQCTHHTQEFVSAPFHVWPTWADGVLGPDIRIRKKVQQRRQHTDGGLTDTLKIE